MIPAQWLPSLPPPANGWLPVYYEVSEASGTYVRASTALTATGSGLATTRGCGSFPGPGIGPMWSLPARCCTCWTTGCGGGSIGMAKAAHDRTKPTISHQERPNRLGVFFLYRRVVRDFGKGPCQWR
jgi:hypothetical protein